MPSTQPNIAPELVLEDELGGLTVTNTAHLLNCSERHVDRLIDLGLLETFNIGISGRRGKRIKRRSIARLVNERKK
jgi:hypothetical protein